jgi:internalin A
MRFDALAFAVPVGALVAFSPGAVRATVTRDFVVFCTHPANDAEALTVDAMLDQVGELHRSDPATCASAADELASKRFLNLWPNPFETPHPPLTDLGPVATLTGLETLSLSKNAIVDVAPLAALANLTSLELWQNAVVDLSPLAGLTGLTELGVGENAVTDLSPLAGMRELTSLDAHGNHVTDLSPLAGLTKLAWLDLSDTDVADVKPLAGMIDLTDLLVGGSLVCALPPGVQALMAPHANSRGETVKLAVDGLPSARCLR